MHLSTRFILPASCLLALVTACTVGPDVGAGPDADIGVLEFHTGSGPARGHEDITRFGIATVNPWLSPEHRLPEVPKGDSGPSTRNPVVKGVWVTDFPDTRLFDMYNVDDDVDWHNHPDLQVVHALRNFQGSGVESAPVTCSRIRSAIADASAESLREWRAGNVDASHFWAGHAVHIIQDSFSEAHTKRGDEFRRLDDICAYGRDVPGVCEHSFLDLRDRAWRGSFSCTFNPSNRSWGCLKASAQTAALATAGYLYALTWAKVGFSFGEAMSRYFDGHDAWPYSGMFRCDAL